jgi:hypothetical protein
VAVQIKLQTWKWIKYTLRNDSLAIQKQASGMLKDNVEEKLGENNSEGI